MNSTQRLKDSEANSLAPIPLETERIAAEIVDAALRVHRALGPGLLESVYERCMVHELEKRGLGVERQVSLPIVYDDLKLDGGLRLDLLVGNQVIVEIKAVEKLGPVFEAQLLTYLRLSKKRLGFLINFTVPLIEDGIKRMII
jgi:GxxExxY protein